MKNTNIGIGIDDKYNLKPTRCDLIAKPGEKIVTDGVGLFCRRE